MFLGGFSLLLLQHWFTTCLPFEMAKTREIETVFVSVLFYCQPAREQRKFSVFFYFISHSNYFLCYGNSLNYLISYYVKHARSRTIHTFFVTSLNLNSPFDEIKTRKCNFLKYLVSLYLRKCAITIQIFTPICKLFMRWSFSNENNFYNCALFSHFCLY